MTKVLLGALFLVAATLAAAAELRGVVVRISDGDTITVLDGNKRKHRIRLAGIDAPESKQNYGSAAKRHLSDRVHRKSVLVNYHKTDQYGRKVGKVLLDGLDVNLLQVRDGYAWHFRRFASEQSQDDRALYAAAEKEAKRDRRGLWNSTAPIPPWEWRSRPK